MLEAVLIDDHHLFRMSLKCLVEDKLKIANIVATGGSDMDAFNLVKLHNPDFIIMDFYMPNSCGFETCKKLLQKNPDLKIIVLSSLTDGSVIPSRLLKIGVKAIISKLSDEDSIAKAIESISNNKHYVCDTLLNGMLLNFNNLENPFDALSSREIEVANLICQGLTLKEMTNKMNISDRTISTYRSRIFEKLNVKNDVELVKLAYKYNIISI